MTLSSRQTLNVLLACCAFVPRADAQEFRVSTNVYDLHAPGNGDRPRVVARSLTLFRNRKAYDYMPALGEVTIFEPTLRRFTILNVSRSLATTVDFDEIRHLLKARDRETKRMVRELRARTGDGQPDARQALAAIRFQLDPRFEESFDADRNHLKLTSPLVDYDVGCAAAQTEDVLDTYLEYADSTARLNYLLHPQSLFPEIRLALNASLRRHRRIPVQVRRRSGLHGPPLLLAKHHFAWKLDGVDRRHIDDWETLLRDPEVRRLAFPRYQRAVLTGQAKSRR